MEVPTILVLEDELLIALDIECTLSEAGFNVVVTTSCADAEILLDSLTPDAVVLDVQLRDGKCVAVARKLVSRSIPFIVHTGYNGAERDAVFSRGTTIDKPSNPVELVTVVKALIAARVR